jgi:ABC-type Fe3+-hydroxamate transport system substrate-binding protein
MDGVMQEISGRIIGRRDVRLRFATLLDDGTLTVDTSSSPTGSLLYDFGFDLVENASPTVAVGVDELAADADVIILRVDDGEEPPAFPGDVRVVEITGDEARATEEASVLTVGMNGALVERVVLDLDAEFGTG